VCAWLKREKSAFGIDKEIRDCPTPHHPNKTIPLQVRRQPLDRTNEGVVIVQRYGEMRIADSVRKALEKKLPKLTATDVHCRILMLERDQGFVRPEEICNEVEVLREAFPSLERVHEIWICDTATFGTPREWVEFVRREDGTQAESFAFYQGVLHTMSRNGMPVPLT
jgi:hypothetical protein